MSKEEEEEKKKKHLEGKRKVKGLYITCHMVANLTNSQALRQCLLAAATQKTGQVTY